MFFWSLFFRWFKLLNYHVWPFYEFDYVIVQIDFVERKFNWFKITQAFSFEFTDTNFKILQQRLFLMNMMFPSFATFLFLLELLNRAFTLFLILKLNLLFQLFEKLEVHFVLILGLYFQSTWFIWSFLFLLICLSFNCDNSRSTFSSNLWSNFVDFCR